MQSFPIPVLLGLVLFAASATAPMAQTGAGRLDSETEIFSVLATHLSEHAAVIQEGRHPNGDKMGPICEQFGYNVCASEAFLAAHDSGRSEIAAKIVGEKKRKIIDVRGTTEREWADFGNGLEATITYGADGYDPTTIGELDREAFAAAVKDAVGDLTTPIAVVCSLGVRSRAAAMALREAGFTDVINIADGVLGNKAGDGLAAVIGVPVELPE